MSISRTVAILCLAAAVSACSSSGDDARAACTAYEVPASFDPAQPAVSFSKDVAPIFASSCALPSCHGSRGLSNGVYLGDDDPAKTHEALVDAPAGELPEAKLVASGDPKKSFLMRKLDGDQCLFDARCTGASCGASMPKGGAPLPVATRDAIRRWIAQGAKND
jgi:hypothetical protein